MANHYDMRCKGVMDYDGGYTTIQHVFTNMTLLELDEGSFPYIPFPDSSLFDI